MKEKILTKIVKKDYNNRLEKVLSTKDYSEDVKNTLLTMFYKIENGYADYKTIKRETFEKNEYIEKLIGTIDKDCGKIEFIKKNSEDKEIVDRENKKILCLPIETKILYSLAKIQKRNIVVKYIDDTIAQGFSYALNLGNNINMVEPLRDFNGFSWNVIVKDIEELNYNLIYQNIIYLMGNKFIDKWVNNYEPLVDYFDLFRNEIEKKYSKNIEENIVENLLILSIKLKSIYDDDFNKEVKEKVVNLKEEHEKIENRKTYLADISKSKKQKQAQIKNIDKMINDKNLLIEEYEKRNKDLPLEKKIFSIRLLKKMLKEEREKLVSEIDKCNKSMNPKLFLEKKNLIENKLEILDNNEELKDILYKLQDEIMKCMYIDIKVAQEKNDLINLIYQYRYYSLLPINKKQNVMDIEELQDSWSRLTKILINRAIELKVITQIANNEKINYDITQKLLLSKIIRLQDINIKITEESGKNYMTIFDEDIEESKIELKDISKEDINIRFNKKIKLFL